MFTGVSQKPYQNHGDLNESHTKLHRLCDPDGFFVWFINRPSLKPNNNFCDTPDKNIFFGKVVLNLTKSRPKQKTLHKKLFLNMFAFYSTIKSTTSK